MDMAMERKPAAAQRTLSRIRKRTAEALAESGRSAIKNSHVRDPPPPWWQPGWTHAGTVAASSAIRYAKLVLA